jgi:hypothetical protein
MPQSRTVGLSVKLNQLDYTAYFARPAFELWNDGRSILSGLYDAFRPLGVQLNAFAASGSEPAEQGVRVQLGLNGVFTFKYERLLWTINGFTRDQLQEGVSALARGAEWFRRSTPGLAISSHVVSYQAHCEIVGSDITTILGSLNGPRLGIGTDSNTGLIFHFKAPGDSNTEAHLTLDESFTVRRGLYISFLVVTEHDPLDYAPTFAKYRELLDQALERVGGLRILDDTIT